MTDPVPDRIEFEPAGDPLYRDVPLPHRTTIPVLGVPVAFRSNAAAILDIAEAAFGGWRQLEETPELIETDAVTVTIVVHPGDEGGADHAPVSHRLLDGHRFLFSSPGSMGSVDPQRREATAFVTPDLVADRQHFRYAVLEAMVMGCVTPNDRSPVHAAAIVRHGTAIVLAGPSGVGKSTLAYAAARAGLPILAEDTVHLQSQPFRAWGLPGFIHLPTDARQRFPELADALPTLVAAGREKIVVDLRSLDAVPRQPVAEHAVLCLLERAGNEPGIRAADPDAIVDEIMSSLEAGFDLFGDTVDKPLRRLARQGAWRLALPTDPVAVIPGLERLLDEAAR